MTLPLLTSNFLTSHPIMLLYGFWDAYAFLTLALTMLTSCNLAPSLACFLGILSLKRDINAYTLILIKFLSLDMLFLMKHSSRSRHFALDQFWPILHHQISPHGCLCCYHLLPLAQPHSKYSLLRPQRILQCLPCLLVQQIQQLTHPAPLSQYRVLLPMERIQHPPL